MPDTAPPRRKIPVTAAEEHLLLRLRGLAAGIYVGTLEVGGAGIKELVLLNEGSPAQRAKREKLA
jgi:microcompartment protein CcmK/EutM